MHKLQVQLTKPFVSVNSLHRVSFIDVPPDDHFGQEPPQEDVIAEVATRISGQLSNIQQTIALQNSQVQSTAASYAIEMVRMLMQQDDEVLIARVKRNIEMAIEAGEISETLTVFVHPLLFDPVREHLSGEAYESISIESESTLAKTDCRVEFCDNGLIASLDHQLEVVTSRLVETIASGVTS